MDRKTSKAWAVSVVGFISVQILEKKYGVYLSPEVAEWASTGLEILFFAGAAWLNRKVIAKFLAQHPFDGGATDAQRTNTFVSNK